MLNVIMRLGLPGNSTLENRFLSVDIASTLFYWDQRAAKDDTPATGHLSTLKTDGSQPAGMATLESTTPMVALLHSGDVEHQNRYTQVGMFISLFAQMWTGLELKYILSNVSCMCRLDPSRLTPSMHEMIVNFLLRMAFVR